MIYMLILKNLVNPVYGSLPTTAINRPTFPCTLFSFRYEKNRSVRHIVQIGAI